MWRGYQNYDHFYEFSQKKEWLEECIKYATDEVGQPTRVQVGKDYIWNIPISFDIETSSYKVKGQKRATMYMWALCFNGSSILGRTWDEFLDIFQALSKVFNTQKTKMLIYVHNLGYEFQFMRNWLTFDKVFAVKERRPIYASTPEGIEFRCSYILSNYALSYIGQNLLNRYPVQKDVGALNYRLVRHWLTNVSETEKWYNIHDVQVVTSFIQEKIENEGGIQNIQLTNTGYVRKYCRDYCFTQNQTEPKIIKKIKARYHERMKSLKIVSKCEYDQLQAAFGGGFTHAAPSHSGSVVENCGSADLASSYPAVMVMKKFPMGRGTFIGKCEESDIDWLTKHNYCSIFTIKMYNLSPKFIYENYISVSHCQELSKDAVINNGRVASASVCQLVVTEQDWDIIRKCYSWSSIEFHNLRIYPADYLPRPLIMAILHLFGNKTSLKGIDEKITEYMVSKNMINAAYGMSVTSIIRDIYEYSNSDSWLTNKANVMEQLETYNESYNRFLFYGWGVWVTAHARHNLWDAIFEFGEDYVYCDTDSIKGLNFEDHELFFWLYNENIKKQLKTMCNYWKIDYDLCQPKTIKGKRKLIGVYEIEETYKKFKSIGAKRYIYEYEDGHLNFTISGVNKTYGVPYLLSTYANSEYSELYRLVYRPNFDELEESKEATKKFLNLHDSGVIPYDAIFEEFNEGLYFPPEATGKNTLTYMDEGFTEICTDYEGKSAVVMELSYIHMEPQSYFMSQTVAYMNFLRGYQDATI